jgi:hypothetical protein
MPCIFLDRFPRNVGTYLGSSVLRVEDGGFGIYLPNYVTSQRTVPVFKRHAVKTSAGGIAPQIPNLGTMWRCIVSVMLRPLYPQYPLDSGLVCSQSRSGRSGEEKYISPLQGIEPGRLACSLVTILSYPDST